MKLLKTFEQNIFKVLSLVALIGFAYLFIESLSGRWFHPAWTTDDALQQIYPFHKIHNPNLFQNDLITSVMEGYLPPIHYYLSYIITVIVGDPILMGHYLMLLQIALVFIFVFKNVKQNANFTSACLACLWLLHARPFMQRLTGGLPRAWPAAFLAVFLYFLFKKDYNKILIILFFGTLLHPPACLIAGVTYGLYLLYLYCFEDRKLLKQILILLLLSPIYAAITYQVIKRPVEIGGMVSIAEASKLPEFLKPHGRFPFVPLDPILEELDQFAIQLFKSRLYSPKNNLQKQIRNNLLLIVALLLVLILVKYKSYIPPALICYLIAIIICYQASRIFAFKLYVPDRHLQLPLAIFWVNLIPIVLGRLWNTNQLKLKKISISLAVFVAALSLIGAGTGLQGDLNFNYSRDKHGKVFIYTSANIPETALIAGHPTLIDGLALFGKRQAYATTETAHPFYQNYFKEMLRRIKIAMSAHYSINLKEFYEILKAEKIDYFVFSRKEFYPENLSKVEYFEPLDAFVKNLAQQKIDNYVYKQIVNQENFKDLPYVKFVDKKSLMVDIAQLGMFLEQQ